MAEVKIDGTSYDTDKMSAEARSTLASVSFVDQQLKLKAHELNIAKTAQAAYAAAFKKELGHVTSTKTTEGEN